MFRRVCSEFGLQMCCELIVRYLVQIVQVLSGKGTGCPAQLGPPIEYSHVYVEDRMPMWVWTAGVPG